MKNKIIIVSLASLLFAGTVYASSLNGEYKGNPIVIVKSDGKTLETDEVPAMIYDNHTVVPISLLRQLGASVTWDSKAYTVNVKLPQQQISTLNDLSQFVAAVKSNLKSNGIFVNSYSIDTDEQGSFAHAVYQPSNSETIDQQSSDLAIILALVTVYKNAPLDGTIIEIRNGNQTAGTVSTSYDNARKYVNREISYPEFKQTWSIKNFTPLAN